jgi:aldehyde dehydrogenase (NAD+)
MITIANQFGMKEALAQLGIKDVNEGTSTGLNHFRRNSRKLFTRRWSIDSKVKTTTAADYEK